MNYRAEVDGLRALAVLPVILFHAGFDTFSGGFVGVDVFFVISGYLITTILIHDLEANQFSVVNFYERRARRILPVLYFVLLVCLPFAWLWMLPSQARDFSLSLIAVSLFLSNVFFYEESGYFAAVSEEKPLLHTWSLAVEEQYYLFFPILLLFGWRFGKNRVFWVIVAISIASLALSEWGWRNKPMANFYLVYTRAWELFAGSIVAFIIQRRGIGSSNFLSITGLLAILIAIFVFDENTPFPSIYALIPVSGVALLLMFAGKETLVARLLSFRLFVGIGLISYSAYLWHQPLFAFARIRLLAEPSEWMMLSLSVLSLLLAIVTWRFVEKPFRGPNALLGSKKEVFGFSLVGLLFFIAIGYAGYATKGFEYRFEKLLEGDVNHVVFHEYLDSQYVDCEPSVIANEALRWDDFLRCKQTKDGEADWVLLGDSHAEHLFLGFAEALPESNIAFYILGGKPYRSNPDYQTIYDVLLTPQQPKNILLTMHYVEHLEKAASPKDDLHEGFGKTIEALQAAGHTVYVAGDIPRYQIHPEDCLYANDLLVVQDYCSLSKNEAKLQELVYHQTLTNLSDELNFKYMPISDYLCDANRCSMVKGDTILYRDENHLNIPGSVLIGAKLGQIIQAH